MTKAEVLEPLGYVGDLVEPFLPDDLLVALIGVDEEKDPTALLIGLTPRSLTAVKVHVTDNNRNGFVTRLADVTQESLPLSEVASWSSRCKGEPERGSTGRKLTSIRDASAEVHLRKPLLDLGDVLKLPPEGHQAGDSQKAADQVRHFLNTLESVR